MQNRSAQLAALIESLKRLSDLLQKDPQDPWRNEIQNFLTEATLLQKEGFTQQDLNALSASIRSIYGGMGSFNDYLPLDDGQVVDWIDHLRALSSEVYQDAFSLRSSIR